MKIILASKSPRRKELLELMGIQDFEVKVSNVDETLKENLTIQEQIKDLAHRKAKAVLDTMSEDCIVIGADTIVVKNGKIYGKPKTKQEAYEMLKELSNATHQVVTGVCVLKQEDGKVTCYVDEDTTQIEIKPLTDQEIMDWIDSGEAMDKAGAYAIQGKFAVHIQKMNGNYHSVMGLPINKLYDIMKVIEKE